MADKVLAALRLALEVDGWEVKEVRKCQVRVKTARTESSAVTKDVTNISTGTTL